MVTNHVEAPPLLDAPAAALLAAQLRSNRTLTELLLMVVGLFEDPQSGALFLNALVAHPSLRVLRLDGNLVPEHGRQAVGDALRALLEANTPALHELHLYCCHLGEAGMAPLLDGLRHNAHLRSLHCAHNNISEAFAAEQLLPAVRANVSLRELDAGDTPGAAEAEALVRAR